MKAIGQYTRDEIMTQPEAWEQALEVLQNRSADLLAFYRSGKFDQIVFTGCGSTYYLALAAAAAMQSLAGIPSRGLPASEIWLYPDAAYPKNRRTLLIPVSRSGETTETLRAVQAFRKNGQGEVLALTCYPESPLASAGSANLLLPSGQETSIAQTRAFTTLYLGTLGLASLWSGKPGGMDEFSSLPGSCRRLLSNYADLARRLGPDTGLDRFYFLGSGPRYGLACELSLKMKEMTLSHSEPFHFMEFRHGPQAMVTQTTLMIGLVSASRQAEEMAVLSDMARRGARILSVGESGTDVVFDSGLSELVYGPLYLPAGQLIAFERALSRRLDPDHPHNLDAVVKL